MILDKYSRGSIKGKHHLTTVFFKKLYIYICAHIKLPQNFRSRGKTKQFFSLVTRKSVQNIRGIFRVSQDKENRELYNGQKWPLKYLKIVLQNEGKKERKIPQNRLKISQNGLQERWTYCEKCF